MFCSRCGKEVPDGFTICADCDACESQQSNQTQQAQRSKGPTIAVKCPECGMSYKIPVINAGRTGKCICGKMIYIPAKQSEPVSSDFLFPPTPRKYYPLAMVSFIGSLLGPFLPAILMGYGIFESISLIVIAELLSLIFGIFSIKKIGNNNELKGYGFAIAAVVISSFFLTLPVIVYLLACL